MEKKNNKKREADGLKEKNNSRVPRFKRPVKKKILLDEEEPEPKPKQREEWQGHR